jgi:hypothetical protein
VQSSQRGRTALSNPARIGAAPAVQLQVRAVKAMMVIFFMDFPGLSLSIL